MALSFFKQKDIDEMDINNIPEEFVNYFETLDDMAKLALLEKCLALICKVQRKLN